MFQKIPSILFALLLMLSFAFRPASADQCTSQQGQDFIDAGQYKKAVQEFTCLINNQPTEVEGYRGRIEAELMLDQYSDAILDYANIARMVVPVNPNAQSIILGDYAERLKASPDNIPALTGYSFAQWWYFSYSQAIHTLNHLLELQPDNVYANLFRGSSRLLSGSAKNKGLDDLGYGLSLDPNNPHAHYIAADAFTYGGLPDLQRAFAEASLALDGGLDTPRVHAILGSAYNAFGDQASAAEHIKTHIDLVTTELFTTSDLGVDTTFKLDLVPGRSYQIPVTVIAGDMFKVITSSKDYWDTILVLLAPDGTPVLGSDDSSAYFAAFEWTAEESGTYVIQVTFFESTVAGELVVTRN